MTTRNSWRVVPLLSSVISNASQPPFLGTTAIVDGAGQIVAITTEARAPRLLAAFMALDEVDDAWTIPDAPPVAHPPEHTTRIYRKQMAAEATALQGLLFPHGHADIQNELGD